MGFFGERLLLHVKEETKNAPPTAVFRKSRLDIDIFIPL
jgi:hypothetical protein